MHLTRDEIARLKEILNTRELMAREIQFFGYYIDRLRRPAANRTSHKFIHARSCLEKLDAAEVTLIEKLGADQVHRYTGNGDFLSFILRSNKAINKILNRMLAELSQQRGAFDAST